MGLGKKEFEQKRVLGLLTKICSCKGIDRSVTLLNITFSFPSQSTSVLPPPDLFSDLQFP